MGLARYSGGLGTVFPLFFLCIVSLMADYLALFYIVNWKLN
jgi:hypothetical protein